MEETLILAGSGGCMRELLWQIEEQNRLWDVHKTNGNQDRQVSIWRVQGYVDLTEEAGAVSVGGKQYPYLGTDDYLLNRREKTNVAVCVGSSSLRRRIAEKLSANPWLEFPNLVLANACICADLHMGQGNIISMDCRVSTHVSMGDFNFLNIGATVCHDGTLGDYITMSPGAVLAGSVTVGNGSELGMGTRVIQGIEIGRNAITGAGSVIVRDIPDGVTVAGVPGRVISSAGRKDTR